MIYMKILEEEKQIYLATLENIKKGCKSGFLVKLEVYPRAPPDTFSRTPILD